jgi:acetyltransferase-like isoleucine patch superfamily enzyme
MANMKPLIFLGSSWVLELLTETCAENSIDVAGIIDSDYFGNTASLCGLPVLDTETVFEQSEKLEYYKKNFTFFCAVNWQPIQDSINQRNCKKRKYLIDLIDHYDLPCTNIIDSRSKISPSVVLGKGIYVGEFVSINPKTKIQDYVSIYGQTSIGHDCEIGRNTVVQRRCCLTGDLIVESDVFVASNVCILKNHSRIAHGTFVHECIYLRRSTLPNEIVSLDGANLRRVRAYPNKVDQ